MQNDNQASETLVAYSVWDRTTRWFHWINAVSVLLLVIFGLAIWNEDTLGFSHEGVMLMKTLHVYAGYVFAINLGWRLIWAFIGNAHARWKAILPFQKGFMGKLRQYVRDLSSGTASAYLGHDPLSRLMVALLLLLLTTQAISGLVLASTDLYMPPVGGVMAEWVTGGDADKLANLQPGSKEFLDPTGYQEMRAFRKPFRNVHHYLFYFLLFFIVTHIVGAILAEIKQRHGLISAMFTGRKVFSSPPVDESKEE